MHDVQARFEFGGEFPRPLDRRAALQAEIDRTQNVAERQGLRRRRLLLDMSAGQHRAVGVVQNFGQ